MNAGSNPAATSILIMRVTILLPVLLSACVPPSYAYLSLPIENLEARTLELALLEVPLADLEARMGKLQIEHLAFYTEGREALPYQLVDRDGDGHPDHALIKIPLEAAGGTLVVTSPGPRNPAALPPGGERYRVNLRFDRARR